MPCLPGLTCPGGIDHYSWLVHHTAPSPAPTLHSTMDAHTFGMRSNAHSNSSNAYANGANQVRAPAGPGRRARGGPRPQLLTTPSLALQR